MICAPFFKASAGLLSALFAVGAMAQNPIEFERDIAGIIDGHCVTCHQSNGRAPFSLEGYEHVSEQLEAIGNVLETGTMPPWLPQPGFGDFRAPHRLSDQDRKTILQWIAQGAPRGPVPNAPPANHNEVRTPDLVVGTAEPFELPADGLPFYRSFVVPLNLKDRRHVSAIELRPGTPRALGHATIWQDKAKFARTLDDMDPEPGFTGVETCLTGADQLIGWSPANPRRELGDIAWTLSPVSELVVELYLMPTGKPEQISFELALEFQAEPPAVASATLHPSVTDMVIPKDRSPHVEKRSMTLDTNCKAISILPSAGPLCREIRILAKVGGSTLTPLIRIKDWDPQWQREYFFSEPVAFSENTQIVAEFIYDNTSGNKRNPNDPPVPVPWGLEKNSEHAEFWIKVIPDDAADLETLRRRFTKLEMEMLIKGYEFIIRNDPENFDANARLGHVLAGENRTKEAQPFLEAARALQPNSWNVLHNLGLTYVSQNQLEEAQKSFGDALKARPNYAPSRKGLALTLAMGGELEASVPEFEKYLATRPGDYETHNNFGVILAQLNRREEAERAYRTAIEKGGMASRTHGSLARLLAATGRTDEAEKLLRETIPGADQRTAQRLRILLARLLVGAGKGEKARPILEAVLAEEPDHPDAKAGLKALDGPKTTPLDVR